MTEEDRANQEQLMQILRTLDPELYLIKMALRETGLNPMLVPKIIQTIANLSFGSGYGKVQIFMQARIVTAVKGEEAHELNLPAILDTQDML
jgi:hypothetical protein